MVGLKVGNFAGGWIVLWFGFWVLDYYFWCGECGECGAD